MNRALLSTLLMAGQVADRAAATPGEIAYSVTFVDPTGALAGYESAITDHVLAAGGAWDAVTLGGASIEVFVEAAFDIPRATGRSVTTGFVGFIDGFNVFEQGMAHEVLTGVDPSGDDFDVEIRLAPDYVQNELWFDPDPFTRVEPVPIDRTDAMSVFLHELGHALAFNGWLDGETGELPGDFRSPWDARVEPIGDDFFFTGPNTTALLGGPAAVTFGNANHLGNDSPRAGEELIPDLMNGVVFNRGERYDISPLDRAVLRDVGLAVVPDAPGDYDGDGLASPLDYDVWSRAYGSGEALIADGDGDGVVTAADYTVWRDAAQGAVAIPEPAGLAGAVVAALVGPARRRRGGGLVSS